MKQETALDILKTGKSVFLTGSAGTGKTHLLNQYIKYLKERKVNPSVVAPTGIAASHLKGSTVHSFFGLGIREKIDDFFLDSILQRKYLNDRFSKLKVLIIDEVSMVSPDVFSSMDKILRAFKFTNEPFGGIQIILSGDFFQLPPVSSNMLGKKFAWQTSVWRELNLKTCYLQKNFRQGNNDLIKVLDNIRSGEISEEAYEIFKSRQNKELDINFRPTKLYTHNIDVDRINNQELEKLDGGLRVFVQKSSGQKKNVEKIFKSSLVLEEVKLKKNAVVLFIKNNYEKGYVNGTTGVVVDFDRDSGMPIIEIFSGRKILTALEDWSIEDDEGNVIAKVSQVPLRLAWAITVHKSQGMTLDAAEVDLSKTFQPGQGYVALSRVRGIEGLRLVGMNDMALKVSPIILQINQRMEEASKKSEMEIKKFSLKKIIELSNIFIKKIGGVIDKKEIWKERKKIKKEKDSDDKNFVSEKIPSWKKTRELVNELKSISEIADKRCVSPDTIFRHFNLIKANEPEFSFEKFKPDKGVFEMVCEEVQSLRKENKKKDFIESGELKLKSIFDALDREVSYDDIKISLLFL